jgi:hypothetical protein
MAASTSRPPNLYRFDLSELTVPEVLPSRPHPVENCETKKLYRMRLARKNNASTDLLQPPSDVDANHM